MGTEPGQDSSKPETRRLLTAADYFLQRRNFADCCKYAARARDSDPTNPAVTRILSTAAVLSASKISSTQHDYYAVLNLPYFDSDASRIGSSFETLASILDPNANPCPFTSEAFDLAIKAWSVLSNSDEKVKFDDELRRHIAGRTSGSGGGTFWTMCPYCYYVYEYDKVFEDCCLRCANEKCKRVLHAVAIGGAPPPDVVEKGQYCCPGFMPFAVRGTNGEGIGENLWFPFAPAHYLGKGLDLNCASYGDSSVVLDGGTDVGKGFQDHGNGKTKIEAEDGKRPENAGEVRMKRKKSVPWTSKKLMGRGIRIDSDQAHFVYGVREERYSNVDKDEGELPEPCFGGQTVDEVNGGVEFIEGDDDVFISLPCDFDLENGRPMTL
ncbi:hypothetical protein C2S52_021432 [Perilla frutescens var. hirtella]|nr:hypothetical protein C2S52_021432 [Perilla frutescens var. hirtella]KAH6808114.1 hypothetical protein C2S51_029222 [Perilla frutescens var. frutescens]